MSYKKEFDVETAPAEKPTFTNETDSAEYIGDEGAVHAETFVIGDSFYAKAQRLAGKFGVEQRGIERAPSDERLPAGMSQIGTLVSSQNLGKIEKRSSRNSSGYLQTWLCLLSRLELLPTRFSTLDSSTPS
jgi:hypothetical protein